MSMLKRMFASRANENETLYGPLISENESENVDDANDSSSVISDDDTYTSCWKSTPVRCTSTKTNLETETRLWSEYKGHLLEFWPFFFYSVHCESSTNKKLYLE